MHVQIGGPAHSETLPSGSPGNSARRAVVELWRIGVRPEEIPDHLPQIGLAQVFDALSYYADHREQVDRFIDINRVEDHEVHPSIHGK